MNTGKKSVVTYKDVAIRSRHIPIYSLLFNIHDWYPGHGIIWMCLRIPSQPLEIDFSRPIQSIMFVSFQYSSVNYPSEFLQHPYQISSPSNEGYPHQFWIYTPIYHHPRDISHSNYIQCATFIPYIHVF